MQSVKCIAVTQPKILKDGEVPEYLMSVEEFLAYVARVSNPSNQSNTLTAPKLLKYLVKNRHWSPFEMVHLVMDIQTTRDIGRQILRHRSFSFQEFSQRYADPTKMEFMIREARLQDTTNRQNSIEFEDENKKIWWLNEQKKVITQAKESYAWAIENGIAKEQARVVLPEGLTSTRMYKGGTLRSFIHYCDLRMKSSTQKEHREIAIMEWQEVLENFPSLSELVVGQTE